MFYVYFIINMIYNTHNRTTLLKQPNSDKKNNCAKFRETDELSISLVYYFTDCKQSFTLFGSRK